MLAVERVQNLPVLLLVTARPEFKAPWPAYAHVTTVELTRLSRREAVALVERVASGKALPGEVLEQIVARTDGVPLFLEELTKTVLESGPSPRPAIPLTLHDSLMARLDRRDASVREVAKIGAALGREFGYDLLCAVAEVPRPELDEALSQLVASELVFPRGAPPQAVYTFKHALVRDAAYGSLLRGARQQLHARITETIECQFPEMVEAQPELLAHHCTEAGLRAKAIGYWRAAGEQAVRRAANLEAIEHFRRALALNEAEPDGVTHSRTELAILSQLGPALMSIHGWPAREVSAAFERAIEVARRLESSVELTSPLVGLWLVHTSRGEFARAEEISRELFRIARELEDPEVLLQAHHAAWPTRFLRGLLEDASRHIDAGIALYDERRHDRHRYIYLGHDPAVCALAIGATVRWLLGYPTHAIRLESEAVALARKLRHAPSLAHAFWFVGESQVARGDVVAVIGTATELLALCDEQRLPQPRASALMFLGWALGRTGEIDEGTRCLEEGLGVWNALGARSYLPRGICLLAESRFTARRYADALQLVESALAVAAETGELWCVPRLHQLRAEVLLQVHGASDEVAETSLRTAIDVARAQRSRSFELRASTALARVWCDQGKRVAARDLLAPIHGWFTEGYDTADLKDATALLDTLR